MRSSEDVVGQVRREQMRSSEDVVGQVRCDMVRSRLVQGKGGQVRSNDG